MSNRIKSISLKKLLIIISMLVFTIILNALGTLRVESIEKLPTEHMNLEVRDSDGKWAAILIVKTELRNLGFRSVSRPIIQPAEYDEGKHEYTFYMNDNQRVIEITHSDYEALEVRLLADFGIEVKAQRVYELKLTFDKEVVQIPVMISCNQSGTEVFIDGESVGRIQNKMLTVNIGSGSRTIRVVKDGFGTEERTENISMRNNSFDFKLAPAMHAAVTISTNPAGATVYIDNLKFGVTPEISFFKAGTYPIIIEKENYETINSQITIIEPETEKSYNLVDIRATLTIKTDSDAIVIFKGETYNGGISNLILPPQVINFKIEQEYCETISRNYTLKKGETKIFKLYPKDISATLTIKTHPNATVKYNGKDYKSGIDKLVLFPQIVNFTIEQEYCKTIEETYTLKKGEKKFFELYPEDIAAYLTIKTYPNATVKFNGKSYKGGISNQKITPQVLVITVIMPKAKTIERVITLKPKVNETFEIYPEVQTGIIQVMTIPTNAKIELKGDSGEFYTATGRKTFTDVPVGSYKLTVSVDEYKTHKENFRLTTDNTVLKQISLEKGSDINDRGRSITRKHHIIEAGETFSEITNLYNITKTELLEFNNMKKEPNKLWSGAIIWLEFEKKDEKKKKDVHRERANKLIEELNDMQDKKVKESEKEKKQIKKTPKNNVKKTRFSGKLRKNEEFAKKIYDTSDIVEKGEVYTFDGIIGILSLAANEKLAGLSTSLRYIFLEHKDCLQVPIFIKFHALNPMVIDESNYSSFLGFSLLGNSMFSSELAMIDVFSLNAGFLLSTNNHRNRLFFEIDAGAKYAFGYNLTFNNEKITFIKKIKIENDELNVDKTTFGGWIPADISISLERHLGGLSFIILKTGIFVTTEEGTHPDAEWYVKDEIENWQSGDPLPQPIDEKPYHPIYQEIVPYIGVGIRF